MKIDEKKKKEETMHTIVGRSRAHFILMKPGEEVVGVVE